MKILVVNSDFSDIFEYSRFFLHKNFSSKHTFEFWVKSNRNAIKTYSLKKIINKIIFLLKKGDFLKFAGFRLGLIFSKDIHKFEKSKWRKINKFFKPLIKKNIEAKYFDNINYALGNVKPNEYDLLIVFGAPYILNDNLRRFKFLLNLHLGYLPDYAGIKTLEWPILKNDVKKIGITIHKLTEIIDGGEIYSRSIIDVKKCNDIAEVYIDAVNLGLDELKKILNKTPPYKKLSSTNNYTYYSSYLFKNKNFIQLEKYFKKRKKLKR